MKYNKKSILLSAVTLGLLTSNLEPSIVSATNETGTGKNDSMVNAAVPVVISQEDGTVYHMVQSGNTVYNISNTYGISQDELIAWNKISDNLIRQKQILSINGVNVYENIIKESHTFSSTKQFINHVAPIALEVAEEYGLYPSVMIAQAVLETGSGTSDLARLANNYFGIKGNYKGNSLYIISPEEFNGEMIGKLSPFRVYPTLYESFVDNGKRLREGPTTNSGDKSWDPVRYQGTWVENTKSYYDATKALVDGGYATDSKYATKLNDIIANNDLIEYDKKIYDHIDESITGPMVPEAPEEAGDSENEKPGDNQEKETSGQSFVAAVVTLPSVLAIEKMNENDLNALGTKIVSAKSLYNNLSSSEKQNQTVARWAGHLTTKETAMNARRAALSANAADTFVNAVVNLPNVSQINKLSMAELDAIQTRTEAARSLYNSLSATNKADATVARWAGHLSTKEVALAARKTALSTNAADTFVDAVLNLPNVSQINKLSIAEIAVVQISTNSAIALYNALSETDKSDATVSRWAGHLTTKESALSNRLADLFIDAVQYLPNTSQIALMNKDQVTSVQAEVKSAKELYNTLSATAKNDATVSRWAGYLTQKERALTDRAASILSAAAQRFIYAVLALPSTGQIEQMNNTQTAAAQTQANAARSMYNGLSSTEKANEKVARWAGYLADKEAALDYNLNTTMSQRFLLAASHLPTVSEINKMTPSQLEKLESEFTKVKAIYNGLTSSEKRNAQVSRWIGYVNDKEAAVANIYKSADNFVAQVSKLPTVSALRKMSGTQLANAQTNIKVARNAYNALPQAAKRFNMVARWEGYLVEKENALGGTSSVRLKGDLEYGVEAGDTFAKIAEKFQVSVDSLIRRNPKLNPNSLTIGQVVYVPNALARPMDQPQARDGKHVIYLDAGHGGWDGGASYSGTLEKDLNLTMAQKLTSSLQAMGYTVINSRTTDRQIDLIDRSKSANATNSDIFVSLHHNAMGVANSNVTGIETFYYKYNKDYKPSINQEYHNYGERIASSAYLANLVQNNLVSATKANDRGVKTGSLAVLRETTIPGILIEFGFMDNSTELAKLKSSSYQNTMANAVAKAIDTYFKTLYK